MAIVFWFFSGWTIQQRLVQISLLVKSMTVDGEARELPTVPLTELGIPASHTIAAMKGHASVNNMAMRTAATMHPSLMDIGCFSYTLDHVGDCIELHWEMVF